MASNTVTSLKTSNSTTSTTSSAPENLNSVTSGPTKNQQGPSAADDDNDSGDEWGMEIGNLIIDLEADLQKDEMKKNDARNTNNNNSVKGSEGNSSSGTSSQPSTISNEPVLNPTNKIETGNPSKSTKSTVTSGGNLTQPTGKTKSKSKKANKSNLNKHGSAANNESSSVDTPNPSTTGTKAVKSDTPSSKPSRNYKKHGKTSNGADKKNEAVGNVKEGREKTSKPGKGNKIPNQSIMGAVSSTSANYSGLALSAPSTSLAQSVNKGKRVNSPSFFKSVSNHNLATTNNILTSIASDIGASGDGTVYSSKTFSMGVNKAPITTPSTHPGKHRKTSSLPSVISYSSPRSMPSSPSALGNPAIDSPMAHGKRERNTMQALTAGNKKIKLDKETKSFASGMTPNDGDSITKGNPANIGANLAGHLSNLKTDLKMTVGQQKLSVESKGDKKSNSSRANSSSSSQHNGKTRNSGNTSGVASMPGGQGGANVPLNNIPTPGDEKRSTGTVTTFADIGVSTEPESLGPCEPGTSVHLSGIVWHETESGVLVVNVTWRNRSYVGTLLDATKHDWAPPRIPDADSDAEYRVKSGRPKRQRGANGNGGDGRKGRKSALANSTIDEYKCSPSNKRRSAKMSESDGGNDGEICTTPSKSAKRARLSRTAAAKQAAQKSASAAAVKESSGDATSGSGSSACSSPVFMECPYANCKKKYEDNNALKYHEAHAHQGDDLEGDDKTRQDDQDSTADSLKDSNDTSPKSVEDIAVSDSSGSPNDTVNETQASESGIISAKMETGPPAASVPFVVTQPQKQNEQYTGHTATSQTTPMHDPSFSKSSQSGESKANINDFSMDTTPDSNTTRREQPVRTDGAASPYTLTDSQANESISLKAHLRCKPPRPYSTSQASTANYTDTTNLPQQDHSSMMEHNTTADDNESAQAVQTLLQLTNSQDQLPGLTPSYGQTSQASSMALTNPVAPTSTPSAPSQPIPTSPGDNLDKTSAESHLKSHPVPHGMSSQFRGHSKDGTPLPRMSVGVASAPRYAVGNYPHGTVAASSSQERHSHYTPTGLKMVKGKTVPIPTDPQQTLSGSSVASAQNTVPGSSGSAKKQKRKKPKSEPGKSPTDPGPKPISSHQVGGRLPGGDEKPMPDQATRIKQEYSHNVIQHSGAPHHRAQHEPYIHPSAGSLQVTPGSVKSEPGSKSPPGNTPPSSRGPGYTHPGISRGHRPHLRHPNPEVPTRDQPPISSTNKNNNNKIPPHGRVSDPIGPSAQVSRPSQASNPGFMDSQQERTHRLNLPSGPGSSHSLPGSRSMTPVNAASHTGSRHGQTQSRLSPGPHNAQRRPSSKESASPQPTDNRKLSNEGKNSSRASFPGRSMYEYGVGQFPLIPYEIGAYPTQLINDPNILQHYGNIIQHEIQKDQKVKEEQSDQHSSRPRSTPSPNPHLKHARPKSPPRNEEPRSRESPPKVHNYHQQGGQLQPGHRVPHGFQRAARESPVPHGTFPVTPNKPGSAGQGRGISPHPQATPSPLSARPPRPGSETERHHRREPSLGERTQPSSRTPTVTPSRKIPSKDGYPEQPSRSPDKTKQGPPPTSVYPSPGVPAVQLPGTRIPVQFYPGFNQHSLIDPRMQPYFAAGSPYVFPPGASHFFHGAWPHGTPPPAMSGAVEKAQSHSPHPPKPSRDRSSSGSRSPYREDAERRPRDVVRGREGESYSSSKERRVSDGPPQSRKSVTPDPKAASSRNPPSDGISGAASPPPTQRHVHTHHHIHEGFPTLIPPHPQYQYQMASAVMAGSETGLAQFPKRDLP